MTLKLLKNSIILKNELMRSQPSVSLYKKEIEFMTHDL